MTVQMRVAKRARRALRLTVQLFADGMRAKAFAFSFQLAKKGFRVTPLREWDLY